MRDMRDNAEGKVVLRKRADADVVGVGVQRELGGLAYEHDAVVVRSVVVRTRLQVVGLVREEGQGLRF
jgi:hypothetical protein